MSPRRLLLVNHVVPGRNILQVVKYYYSSLNMGMPVKLSNELVEAARQEAASTDRSITGQIEHWVKIGRSVEECVLVAATNSNPII